MIIWINGAFGAGKTTTAFDLHIKIKNSRVYDPENVGYFIRKNSPPESELNQGDFQDIELWREINYKMLKLISDKYDGVIIVPMTLVNPQYYDEIIGRLIADGIEVRHFILHTSKETLVKHLKVRGLGSLKRDSFAVKSIDRCIYAFENYIKDEKIAADNRSVDDIVAEIAGKCGLLLPVDKRSKFKKTLDRYIVLLNHIRLR